jgi:nucleotide-binding universal stress UspA family protein
MFERILVPLDGSVMAENVLPQVRRLLHHGPAEIVLVRAVVPVPAENGMVLAGDNLDAAGAYLKTIGEKFSGTRVQSIARIGAAASVILDVAAEEKCTLIGMATHGHGGLKRLLLGSVAESVIRKAPVPVLAIRPFILLEEYRPIQNILVPIERGGAIGPAEDLARLFGARLFLLRVLETIPKKKGVDIGKERMRAESELERLEGDLEVRGVEAVSILQTGQTIEEILETVHTHEIDLIAMNTHGRSGLTRIMKGSITETLLREAPVPMLISRIPKTGRQSLSRDKSGTKSHGSTTIF